MHSMNIFSLPVFVTVCLVLAGMQINVCSSIGCFLEFSCMVPVPLVM
jgi:hypothetical protein